MHFYSEIQYQYIFIIKNILNTFFHNKSHCQTAYRRPNKMAAFVSKLTLFYSKEFQDTFNRE